MQHIAHVIHTSTGHGRLPNSLLKTSSRNEGKVSSVQSALLHKDCLSASPVPLSFALLASFLKVSGRVWQASSCFPGAPCVPAFVCLSAMPQCLDSDTQSAASLLLHSMISHSTALTFACICVVYSRPDKVFKAWCSVSGSMQ